MKVKGVTVQTSSIGEKILVLLAENQEESEKLFHYLSIDAYRFKKEISENKQDLDGLSTGYLDAQSKLSWNEQILPLPKWFDQN